MSKVMKVKEFINIAKEIATNYKTLYVMCGFGAPLNEKNKKRYSNNCAYNRQAARQKMIANATSDTFAFDCVCLIKGILWGWNGDVNKVYGGAIYKSNGVPDFGTESMLNYCSNVSSDFKNIEVGEVLWMKGHAGIYIGDGLAVECTPAWKNKVQITAVGNIGKKDGYNTRKWTKHGKLKYIDYTEEKTVPTPSPEPTSQPNPQPKPEPVNEFKIGDKVVPIELVNYKGVKLIQYDEYYYITGIDKRGAILSALRNDKYEIWAVLALNNIKKI